MIFLIRIGGVESILGPLCTSASEWPIIPAPGDCDDGEFDGMKISRGNRSTRRKPAPAPLRPPQISLDQTRVRTRTAEVGSQRSFSDTCDIPSTNSHVLISLFLFGKLYFSIPLHCLCHKYIHCLQCSEIVNGTTPEDGKLLPKHVAWKW
jgi:hypothetical protein